MALDDWTSKAMGLKSVLAVTAVAADGYPADDATTRFGERRASAENPLREVIEVAGPGLGRVAFVVDVPDVRHVVLLNDAPIVREMTFFLLRHNGMRLTCGGRR
jgi:hypothetical protein